MGLRIDNQTDWDGRALRALITRVIDNTDGYRDRKIVVKTSRTRNKEFHWEHNNDERLYRGRAYLNNRHRRLYMGVPKVTRIVNGNEQHKEFDEQQFARVLEHEIAHNRGLEHGDMTDELRYCRQPIRYSIDDITVEPKPTAQP